MEGFSRENNPSPLHSEIELILEKLNMVPSLELSLMRENIQAQIKAGKLEDVPRLANEMRAQWEERVEEFQGIEYKKAQIGLILTMATIWRKAGLEKYAVSELEDALTYASNMGFDDMVGAIQRELDKK